MNILNDPDALKKLHAYFLQKKNMELLNSRYAGACYEILIECQAVAIVAADIEDNTISHVMLAYIMENKLYEDVLPKKDFVKLLLDNPDVTVGTPNILGKPTEVSVVNNTYLRSDANNTSVDNLGNLPSIEEWQDSQAKKILHQLVAAHFQD